MSARRPREQDIILRPAAEADREFVNDLLWKSMHPYVESTWPNNPEAQEEYYKGSRFNPFNHTQIIQVWGQRVGRLTMAIRKTENWLFISELQILPEYQSQGISASIIKKIIVEAKAMRLPIVLTVLKVNQRALKFYQALGFTQNIATFQDEVVPHSWCMVYEPDPSKTLTYHRM